MDAITRAVQGRKRGINMADIELLIKIPEEDWKFIKDSNGCRWSRAILEGVINGTPLPKGHGRLIDADVLVDGMEDNYEFCEELNATPTVIEADKGENK